MQSVIHYINTEVLNLKKLLNNLMECSDIVRWNYSRIVVSGAGDYQWEALNDNGRKIQDQLCNEYARFISLIRFLLTDLTGTQQRVLSTSAQKVQNLIEQSGLLFKMDKEEQLNDAVKALDLLFQLIAAAYEVTEEYCIIIPDSSALIANPELEKWNFDEIHRFKILLLPIIANDLDKDTANNEIKNKILEYAKRGSLLEGIKINEQNIIQLAGDLQIEKTLPWLDINDNYDKIIATYFEIVKVNPHSQVVLITNNSSLQEKALLSNVIHSKPPVRKIEGTPAKRAPVKSMPIDDIKPDVEPVKPAPSNSKNQKAMPQGADSKSENKPIKVTIPPIIQNKPPIGIKTKAPKPPRPPKIKFPPNFNTAKADSKKSSAVKPKR